MVSLPASDSTASPHAQANDVEVGGQRGREALDRLRNVIGRIESSWRPASAEEGFEIVRRRLFEPFADPDQFKDRDVVARAFADFYRRQHQEFPPECRDADYEKRIGAAYPIHPEIFDRLYTDWSTLVTFPAHPRRAAADGGGHPQPVAEGRSQPPLILLTNMSIDDRQVQFELTRYLPENWVPVIEKDVDGQQALPLRIDGEVANLGKSSACRRVARTVYLGSAPTAGAAQRGLEDRRIKLGCVLPGESPAVFGDALRRLASAATYLYQDGPRYWYATQPTVTKLAEDRAEQLRRDQDRVIQAIGDRLRAALRDTGGFSRIHSGPRSGHDVPDERETRLVVFGIDHPHHRDPGSPAEKAGTAILETRGTTPRLYRNRALQADDAVSRPRLHLPKRRNSGGPRLPCGIPSSRVKWRCGVDVARSEAQQRSVRRGPCDPAPLRDRPVEPHTGGSAGESLRQSRSRCCRVAAGAEPLLVRGPGDRRPGTLRADH